MQRHGPLSKTELAELVNLSPTPCRERLNRLKAAGIIRGYRADIALDRILDFTIVVVTVALDHHRKADFERFEAISAGGRDRGMHRDGRGLRLCDEGLLPSLPPFRR